MKKGHGSGFILSYLTIRRIIGVLGILIPFLMFFGGLIFGQWKLLDTVSNYYYTNMRDLFVGILCAVALFLMTYKGYPVKGKKINIDNIATNIAGIGALGIAFFPMSLVSLPDHPVPLPVGLFMIKEDISVIIHLASSSVFFIMIAFICLFLFTKTDKKKITGNKMNRNRIYIVCGAVILVCMTLICVYSFFLAKTVLAQIHPLFFLESFGLIAFGFAWLVKGETLLRDKKGN